MLALNDRVAVIDDEPDGRDTIVDLLGEQHFEPIPIIGPFGSDIDRLIAEVDRADPGFVICDHRLTAKQYATFTGLQVVERLIESKRPAMLITTFQEPDLIALRAARSRIPVIKGRDGFQYEQVIRFREIVRRELADQPVASRKPHRVILRVADVRTRDIDIVVPSWNRDHAFILPKMQLANAVRNAVRKGDYLLGDVNIGATHEDEIYFDNVDEIIEEIQDIS
jgi:CheY-like chemotaxis protein